ncbi:MAG: hypothetical protein KDE15_13150 [Erythrobacter sp.]|nr:hypothetical protein [Erythrobacter sp.]
MTDGAPALEALRRWLDGKFAGNVADFTLTAERAEQLRFAGQASYSYSWEESRERADGWHPDTPLDEQVEAAIRKRPLTQGLLDAIRAEPTHWLDTQRGAWLYDYIFYRNRTETCDSCSGKRTFQCSNCDGQGKVTCSRCNGHGTERVACNNCGGSGRVQRSRMVTVYHNGQNQTVTQYYTEGCWTCASSGRVDRTCGNCSGNRKVRCNPCDGKGRITCKDCGGAGERDYVYKRIAVVTAKPALKLPDIGHPGWRDLASSRWSHLLTTGAITTSQIEPTGSPAAGTYKVSFVATGPAVDAVATANGTSGRLISIGGQTPVLSCETILANALAIAAQDDQAGWVAQTERLAGTRLLHQAVDAAEAAAARKKGSTRDQLRAAQQAEIEARLLNEYTSLLGPEAAQAVALTVIDGIGDLSTGATQRVWRHNLMVAGGIGLVGAIAAIIAIATQSTVFDSGFKVAGLIALGTLIATLVWGAIGKRRVRHRLGQLSSELGLDTPLSPPQHGWTRRGTLLGFALGTATLVATLCASYALGLPARYGQSWDRQLSYARSSLESWTVYLQSDAVLYRWPDETSDQLANLPTGTELLLYDVKGGQWTDVGDAEWRLVRAGEQVGYIRQETMGQ